MPSLAIVWLRHDLRLQDNPALSAAAENHERIIPLYIHAPEESGKWHNGAASNWWLHHSLESLDASLKSFNSRLVIRRDTNSLDALRTLIEETGCTHVYWNRVYEPQAIERDKLIKQSLRNEGIVVGSYNASLLFEPWNILTGKDEPYRVFTPFWKACCVAGLDHDPKPAPASLPRVNTRIHSEKLQSLALLPEIHWDSEFYQHWQPGEAGADTALQSFLKNAVDAYSTGRDYPAVTATSLLSPHLHFGELSPQQIVAAARKRSSAKNRAQVDAFLREIGWREFAYHLLYHFPHTVSAPMNPRFEKFGWERASRKRLRAWQQGQTGVPIVDAGMRQLWQTGWMHNRVRMIVASFLTKNMLLHWKHGAEWFWNTLVDADLANNTLGWQWVAGCGADAAPYFRIFNPVTQAEKFDADGDYIRRWVPELSALPNKYIARPWQAPESVLDSVGIQLGKHYPKPIVDLRESRERALARYQATRP